MAQTTLYHYWRSSCSWRLRWALELKGVAHEKKAIHLLNKEQTSEGYLKIAPVGQVPAWQTEQGTLVESMPIMEWLEETHPTPALLPKDPWKKAQVRALCHIIVSGTQPLTNLKVLNGISSEASEREAYARKWIREGIQTFSKQRAHFGFTKGPWVLGESLTMADLCLVPQVYNAHRFGVDMKEFPELQGIYEHALSQASCQAAHPDRFAP